MKTSDYIAHRINKEVDTVFGVTGGCIVNLVNSFKNVGLKIIPTYHEQSAAICADAYARFKGFGVSYATSGPGVANLVSGVCCSYFDSIPVLAIGGQVPSKFLDKNDRQSGFQELDSVNLFKPITKLSKRYRNASDLEQCINVAKSNRKGATFIELPDDIQREDIANVSSTIVTSKQSFNYKPDLSKYNRPLAILGSGCRDAELDIRIPFLCTWGIKDKYCHHPYYKGDFGITGSINGNKLIKESDAIIMIGTKIDSHHYPDWNKFAPNAYKIALGLEFPHSVDELYDIELNFPLTLIGKNWCNRVKDNDSDSDIYKWIDKLSNESNNDDIIIPDMGQTGCIVFQRWNIKDGQRLFNGVNHSPMGYSIAGAIGSSLATGRRVIVIIGDGSLMMNLHDLQTVVELNLPINIFVVNNDGYGMIRQTQADWPQYLNQRLACDFNIPNTKKLADAFGLEYTDKLSNKPTICELKFDNTRIYPKWKYGEEL